MGGREVLLDEVGEVEVVYGEDGCGERMRREAEGVGEGGDLEGAVRELWKGVGREQTRIVAQDGSYEISRQLKGGSAFISHRIHTGLDTRL